MRSLSVVAAGWLGLPACPKQALPRMHRRGMGYLPRVFAGVGNFAVVPSLQIMNTHQVLQGRRPRTSESPCARLFAIGYSDGAQEVLA